MNAPVQSPVDTPEIDVGHFLEHGYVSVPFLSPTEIEELRTTILKIVEHRTQHFPVYHPPYTLEYLHNLHRSISSKLSSTGGAGGVMDIHYDLALDRIRTDPRIFSIVKHIWSQSYGCSAPGFELPPNVFSSYDFTRGYCTIDRICLRCPDSISNYSGRKKRATKCLTPHLDCCPESIHSGLLPPFPPPPPPSSSNLPSAKPCRMWRPVQCFLLLSSNLLPSTGGIELAPGYHKTFFDVDDWTSSRCGDGEQSCFGPFTAVRNRSVTKDIRHIPVSAGSLFFWDEKIPHATALAHLGSEGRVAIYLGFLPHGPCNSLYKEWERGLWERGLIWVGGGQNWINGKEVGGGEDESEEDKELRASGFIREKQRVEKGQEGVQPFDAVGRKLMGIEEWD